MEYKYSKAARIQGQEKARECSSRHVGGFGESRFRALPENFGYDSSLRLRKGEIVNGRKLRGEEIDFICEEKILGRRGGRRRRDFFGCGSQIKAKATLNREKKKPTNLLDEDPIVRFALNGLLFVSSVGCSLRRSKCQARRGKLIIPALSSF